MTGTAMKWLTQDSLSIIKTERQFDMKETTKRKLKRLHQKLNELEERMKKDAIDKRAIQKHIQDIESTEIFNMIRKGGLSLEVVCDDLELGKKLRESGITASEIAEMNTPNQAYFQGNHNLINFSRSYKQKQSNTLKN